MPPAPPAPSKVSGDLSTSQAAALLLKAVPDIPEPPPVPPASDVAHTLFVRAFARLQQLVHATARSEGWWDVNRVDGELVALMHSELSEALEAMRHNNTPDDKIPEFSGVEAELADVIIRIMDFAAARGHRVAEAIVAKVAYNRGREYKHGGKAF